MLSVEINVIYDELLFWKEFVKTRRFLDEWVGVGKTPELQQIVADFILSNVHRKVLDVGSGVVSILNGLIRQSDLFAIDPLGDLYRFVFDYTQYQMIPPIAVSCEEMQHENEFDIVHISNAIDHVQEPCTCYQNLFRAVTPGGYLIVQGFEYEGRYEQYRGLHQWDFSVKNDELCIGDQVIAKNPHVVHRIETKHNRWWYIWIVRK